MPVATFRVGYAIDVAARIASGIVEVALKTQDYKDN